MSELYSTFHNHFDVVSADTVGLMETAFRMRYQVYCLERSYEDAESFPDQMEIDEFDMHSAHSLVRCQRSGQYAGLVRLVLPNPLDTDKPLPLEKFCHSAMEKAGIDLSSISRDCLAETSRYRWKNSATLPWRKRVLIYLPFPGIAWLKFQDSRFQRN
jgi:N-acyl amino acid synthase of PEP-CTERM/exosortase system